MVDTLFFVHPDVFAATDLAAHYRALGWNVATCDPAADDALDRMAEANPVAAVFYLTGACAVEIQTLAGHVQSDGRFNRPFMVFVGGSADEIAAAHSHSPYGVCVSPEELPWVLKRLVFKG